MRVVHLYGWSSVDCDGVGIGEVSGHVFAIDHFQYAGKRGGTTLVNFGNYGVYVDMEPIDVWRILAEVPQSSKREG